MDALRLPASDADVTKLSGGERRRVALCRLLLEKPDMLLLDEPTNHLDAESVAWLERFLQEYPGHGRGPITHDRYFLDNVAGWILELDRGRGIPWEGNYSSWLEQKTQASRGRGKAGGRPRSARSRASSSGCKMSPRARQAKGKARINAYEDLVKQRGPSACTGEASRSAIPPCPSGWATSWSRPRVSRKAFGDKLLIDRARASSSRRGGIVGIIGAERCRQDHAVQA